ncbi:MAG TPA: hypothetical protein VMJ33_11515 [Gallionella sp.]|nr:hypothetical protein [Gallionella sp.]
MVQIVTQPKVTGDLMLAKGDHDMKVIKPIQVDEEVHEKPEHDVPEPLPYVWSM